MSTINSIPFRSTIFYRNDGTVAPLGTVLTIGINNTMSTTNSLSIDTLTASTITVSKLNLQSTVISLGQSTNQTYNNFSNGSYAPVSWVTAKSALSGTNKTVMSANGLYQMIVGNTTSGLFLSSDSGITWTSLTGGLPVLTGSAYWSDGTISANGQYITLSIYGGSLWMSADYGRTFALTNQPTPSIWLPLNGSVADSMGSSTVTTPGTVPGYVTLNYPGYTAQAVNLANTAGGTATRYIRGTWTASDNFMVSLWFNTQSTGVQQIIFDSGNEIAIYINGSQQLCYQYVSNGVPISPIFTAANTIVINTWYYVAVIFQKNGTCSMYLNNTLVGSATNIGGYAPYPSVNQFSLGTYDTDTSLPFNGYVDDLRITHSVSTYVPIPLLQPNIWLPFENNTADLGSQTAASSTIYLPFEGNTTDSMNATNATATGPVTYVAANREGYTGQAIRLTNTAGGTAAQYVRGNWSGATNFTVSFWFNAQSVSAPSNQILFSAYVGAYAVYINTSNRIMYYIPSGGTALDAVTGPVISINTWYYVTAIFQTNGVCSLFVNNSLAGTYTNSGGVSPYATTAFGIGTYDTTLFSSFNGTIDDLRIYNYAITYTPVSIVTVTGSLSYVPGVVGLNAVNLVNPAGGTPVNYISGSWPALTVCTISGWFNIQSFSTTTNQFVCSLAAATGHIIVFIEYTSRKLYVQVGLNQAFIGNALSLNTWYYFQLIVPSSSSATLYLNSDSVTFAYTAGTSAGGGFFIGTFLSGGYAFNGYVDDLRIYNAVIPYHTLLPQNYRSLALSGTGQYALASAASGWVVGSSDVSRTWFKQAVCVGTQGDIIQPNKTGLVQSTWEQNGVNWTSSVSSQLGGTPFSYYAFLNTNDGNIWISAGNYSSGVYNNTYLTTVLSIGTVYGEWLQIQSSIPLIITSYTFQVYNAGNLPKSYYIVGSSDGTTWYPIQSCVLATNPITTTNVKCSNNLLVNFNGTQTLTGNVSSAVTTIAYTYATTPYTYFRIIVTGLFSTATYAEIGEWYVNFARSSTAALSLNHTGQYQLVATGPAAGSIMPQLTGLATNTWTQSGVNWAANASTTFTGYSLYALYNNTPAGAWLSAGSVYNTSTGVYSGSISTTIQSIGSPVFGEWVQIQASVPLVLQSYTYADGGAVANIPKTYYIVGSNDGSTWVPLQFVTMTTNPFTTSTYTTASTSITLNTTGAITIQGNVTGQGTSTAYTFSTQPYMYFRMVITSLWASNAGYCEFTEWLINFQNSVSYSSNYGATWLNTRPTVSNESVALSPSGQYALSTNSVSPFARLTLDNTAADNYGMLVPAAGAGTVTYSTSIKAVGTHSGQFVNTAGGTPSVYLNYTVPTALNTPSALTMACWVYPSTYGVAANSYILNLGSTTQYGCTLGFGADGVVFSYTGKTSGGAQQTIGAGAAPLNTWTHVAMTYNANLITLYVNGVVSGQSAISGNLSLVGGGNITNLLVGCSLISQAFNGYVDDVRIYTSALTATAISTLYNNPTITLSQIVAVSNSYLPITSYTFPALAGIGTATVVDTAVSQTGQYMVAVTSSTTNNVYYSTDYGATFTALTIGTTAMMSCSISYDGSYITVTNTTTTYTLNENTRGFTLAIGNQAGRINQGLNAIAIGDKAGQTNQSNNSIVLNATGVALDAVAPGFYVAPIATAGSSVSGSFAVLGYGTDTQVVQTGLTVLQNGFVGIGTTAPVQLLDITNAGSLTPAIRLQNTFSAGYVSMGSVLGVNSYIGLQATNTTTSALGTPTLIVANNGFVGIGTVNPISALDVNGTINVSGNIIKTGTGPGFIHIFGTTRLETFVDATYGWLGTQSDHPLAFYTNNSSPKVVLTTGGNLAIGTLTPIGKLSVALDGLGDAGGGGAWNSSYALFGPGANNGNGSCVGITYNTAADEGGLICITPNVLWRTMKYSARQHIFYMNGNATPGMTINLGGTIFFNAYNTTGTLAIVATTGQIGLSSDRRIKENIEYQTDTQQGLASVVNLKPATFNFIGSSDSHFGFIAQDVEQEIPMAVDGKKYEWQWEIEDGKPKFDANGDIVYKLDADGNKIIRPRGVSDRAIIATQTLAIQELAKQATSQATLVQELAKQATLQSEILQELTKQATSQSEIVQELTKKETSQSEIVQELAKKLTTAEQQLAAKSAALDALIAWAQTQGYSVTA